MMADDTYTLPSKHIKDLRGMRFNRLTVVAFAGQRGSTGSAYWKCRCDCGTETEARAGGLIFGDVRSCGCLQRDRVTKHGMDGTSEYRTWSSMVSRCYNPNHPGFKNYGARGITVCDFVARELCSVLRRRWAASLTRAQH